MRLSQLLSYFDTSPAIHLLRSPNAPFIVDFLTGTFKRGERIAVPHTELVVALAAYQEGLREIVPDALPTKPEAYLSEWCAAETRWLQRFIEADHEEPLYQLSTHSEEVLQFLDRTLNKELSFVGTESRLKFVMDTLADLAVGAVDDPAARLEHLRAEKRRIESEIEQVERDGQAPAYHPARIRERFGTAVAVLRQLQGDFRAVEQSFRDIALQVQRRQLAGEGTRGAILEFALDAEELLKNEDQGVSFYEFVRLILAPDKIEQLERTISGVRQLPDLQEQQEGLDTVRGMITALQAEAEKVMRTNQRLSAVLRRLLDSRTHAEHQQVGRLLRDIRSNAARLALEPASHQVGLELDLECGIESPFRRQFWIEPPQFEPTNLLAFLPDDEERHAAFERLASLHNLNWKEMRFRVRQMLAVEHAPTLANLLEAHPVEGIVDVIAYLQIAVEDGHVVDQTRCETVTIPPSDFSGRAVEVTIPRVTFVPHRRNGHAK